MNPQIDLTETTRHRRRIARGSAAALAAAGAILMSATASAAPLERGSFHEEGSETFEDFCGDLNMRYDWTVDGQYLGVGVGRDGLIHFRDSVRGTDIWTNLDTGRVYYQKWTANSRDLKVTNNGDGTLTIEVQGAGGSIWFVDDGTRLRDPGMNRFAFIVDDGGTPTDPSDDEWIADIGVTKESTGLNELEGRDFCEDLHLFTT